MRLLTFVQEPVCLTTHQLDQILGIGILCILLLIFIWIITPNDKGDDQ